jgi:hypothetical protein
MSELERIDTAHESLSAQANETVETIRSLARKLQDADAKGSPVAGEWKQDLREIALALQAEQQQVAALLQALHDFVVANAHQAVADPAAEPQYQQPAFQQSAYQPQQQQPQYQADYQQAAPRGGLLSRFFGGRFGSSIAQGAALGVGFGLAEDIIDDIF